MIEVFEGRLGGGKTYTAVYRIAEHLSSGGTVVTNIRVKLDGLKSFVADVWGVEWEDDQLWQLPNEKISEFHRHVPYGSLRGSGEDLRVLVVVDEAHLYFNARDWSQTSKQLLAFLTQSDKVSVDVIFISQSALNIDKQFGRLVQYIWRFRDLKKWKIPGLGIRYPFNQILVCQYDYDGNTMLDRRFVGKDSRVFGCYETAALLTKFPESAGKVHKRVLKKVEKGKVDMRLLIPILIIVGIFGCWGLYSKFTNLGKPDVTAAPQKSAVSETSSRLSSPSAKVQAAKALYTVYEERFRGWSSQEKALITDAGWYQLGEMSGHGIVTAVSDRRARVVGPDGEAVWIVATKRESVDSASVGKGVNDASGFGSSD